MENYFGVGFVRQLVKDIDQVEGDGTGLKFTWWMFAVYAGMKSFYSRNLKETQSPFLRTMGLNSQWVSEWTSFRRLPYQIKPGYALFSDIQPIFGYKKKNYEFIFGLIGTLALLPLIFYFLSNSMSCVLLCSNSGTFQYTKEQFVDCNTKTNAYMIKSAVN